MAMPTSAELPRRRRSRHHRPAGRTATRRPRSAGPCRPGRTGSRPGPGCGRARTAAAADATPGHLRRPSAPVPRLADRVGQPAAATGSFDSATPIASRVRPIATTWARYQVVPSSAAYQSDRPEPEEQRRRDRGRAARSAADRGPRTRWRRRPPRARAATSCASVARPQTATNGISTTAGSGGNGSRA